MVEWIADNKFNSFNSYKGLTYYENYRKIIDWMDGKALVLPPPVECNLDPMAECNLSCYFCITQRYLRHNRQEVGEMRQLPTDYMYRLVDFLARWGVRGLCISGGGEPSLHKGVWGLPPYAVERGMDVSFVTNGVVIPDELLESLMACRWVSVSVDAADFHTYSGIKGANRFDDVVSNIGRLADCRAKSKSAVDISYKFLILPENQHQIYTACKLAKELGVQDFHARPVDFERGDIKGNRKLRFDMGLIQEQFAKCHKEETSGFHVYTVTHKFDPEFHVKHDFENCLATPLVIPILSDGNAYLCVDRKMEDKFRLGSCYPDPEGILDWWGGEYHLAMISSIDISKCSRCTWSQYNRQIEETVLEDKMCLSFP